MRPVTRAAAGRGGARPDAVAHRRAGGAGTRRHRDHAQRRRVRAASTCRPSCGAISPISTARTDPCPPAFPRNDVMTASEASARSPAASRRQPLRRVWETPFGLPPFAAITPEHIRPAFDAALAKHKDGDRRDRRRSGRARFRQYDRGAGAGGQRAQPRRRRLLQSARAPTRTRRCRRSSARCRRSPRGTGRRS